MADDEEAGGGAVNGDCDGHGTHIAATAAGREVGVAPAATLHPVRVLGCDGGGRASDVVAGRTRQMLRAASSDPV